MNSEFASGFGQPTVFFSRALARIFVFLFLQVKQVNLRPSPTQSSTNTSTTMQHIHFADIDLDNIDLEVELDLDADVDLDAEEIGILTTYRQKKLIKVTPPPFLYMWALSCAIHVRP